MSRDGEPMKYKIRHACKDITLPPVPEAIEVITGKGDWEIEIHDIREFCRQYGNVTISPPEHCPLPHHWVITVIRMTG